VVFTHELLPFEVECVAHTCHFRAFVGNNPVWGMVSFSSSFFYTVGVESRPILGSAFYQDLCTISSYLDPFLVGFDSDARTPALKERDM
jgi:hypothetical protein